MKSTVAGTLLPSIFYLLTLLRSSSVYAVPAISPGFSHTFVPNQVLAQAQQQTVYPVSTTYTVLNPKAGEPSTRTIYNCPKDTARPTATFIAVVETFETSYPTITDFACLGAEQTKSGLSQGAIAGIAVGVSIPVLAGVFFVFWRLWKKDQEETVRRAQAFRQNRTQGLHPRRNKSISTVSGDTEGLTVPGKAKSRGGVVTEITAGN